MTFWNFKAAKDGKNPELYVYGYIGEWMDVDARRFTQELRAIDAPEIDVRINSDGGSVFTAQAIYSSLKRHTAKINVLIDGMAASAATIIAMAGDVIKMPSNAMLMIHNPLAYASGNAEEMRDLADILDKVRDTLVAVYRDKTGLADEKIIELMDAETYMTADEALELGFVDEVDQLLKIAATLRRDKMIVNGLTIDHKRHPNMPEKWLNAVQSTPIPGTAGNPEAKENPIMNLDQLKAEHPDLYQAVLDQGVQAGQTQERDRIKAIDDMAMPGHEALAAKAKFETGITAEAYAVEVIKAEKEAKGKFIQNRKDDAAPLNGIKPSEDEGDAAAQAEAKRAGVVSAAAKAFSARNGHKTTS